MDARQDSGNENVQREVKGNMIALILIAGKIRMGVHPHYPVIGLFDKAVTGDKMTRDKLAEAWL